MRRACPAVFHVALLAACAGAPERHTLAELRDAEPDMNEVRVENSLEQAMSGYGKFLAEAPESALTPEAMRRLADLKLEKEYGPLGDGEPGALPAPEAGRPAPAAASERAPAADLAEPTESDTDFERRATDEERLASPGPWRDAELPGGLDASEAGPLEAIALYDQILADYPRYAQNDQVLYQKARAYDELGQSDEAIAVLERLIAEYPRSRHVDEALFRRAEYFFTRRRYREAEEAYAAISRSGPGSEYYELALYKLGWTFYKQELHEEALDQYIALLDYKVSTGYDFDAANDEDSERRIADTYRVISLCFSNLGGPEAVQQTFAAKGPRSYEDRIYSQLGEFYLDKLRYDDAANAYQAFVKLHPLHRAAPHFSMRVVEIYEAAGFPKLVLESKKEFAARYGLDSEYWRHYDVADAPEVLGYLKTNLVDLANHHHALYQDEEFADQKPENFAEATRWYRAYLASFPTDPGAPAVNRRLADLLLEDEDFADAAREYQRTAYDYPAHEGAAAAGYAAIFAHRENQKRAAGAEKEAARRDAVASSLRFADTFPEHEHAAAVMGAAVDDLFRMKEFERALATGRALIDRYPTAEPSILRDAWTVVAHSSLELTDYVQAEQAYTRVRDMTPEGDPSRPAVEDNLAAAIYKQGEQASQAGENRAAAEHFLRIAQAAPDSGIRPAAEYDAAAALIRLEDWSGAAGVLEAFRQAHPDHPLAPEATKQLAMVYHEQGDLARSAGEYERIAREAGDPELRRQALLAAAGLYDDAHAADRALAVRLRYVDEFPTPVEAAAEARFAIAAAYQTLHDEPSRMEQLRRIVAIDGTAGGERSERVRTLAARSALVLAQHLYERFGEVTLVQPFEEQLREKQQRMNEALESFGALVDYEVGDVTAAATFYMAEIYSDFSRALHDSERPRDLAPAELRDYEQALDDMAYPFEEKAIEVHEKNLELMRAGVYDSWIEKSLAKLAELVPGRYAKSEASSGFIEAIDHYAYQPPRPPADAVDAAVNLPGTPESTSPPGTPGATTPVDASATVSATGRAQPPAAALDEVRLRGTEDFRETPVDSEDAPPAAPEEPGYAPSAVPEEVEDAPAEEVPAPAEEVEPAPPEEVERAPDGAQEVGDAGPQ